MKLGDIQNPLEILLAKQAIVPDQNSIIQVDNWAEIEQLIQSEED